jgi:hypothetical protein
MRIQNISSFANVICRFVVDAISMLRFKLSQSSWHLKSSAGSVLCGSSRKDRLFGNQIFANNGQAFYPANLKSLLYSLIYGPTMLPALVTTTGLTVRASERSLRLPHLERLATTAPVQQRHS